MFNNPFDSFHDTVAEAKQEREGLDRLLTTSSPRERLLLAAIAIVLVGLAAWLLLAGVARSVGVVGVLIDPDGIPGNDRSIEVLAWIDRDAALRLAPGMRVVVEFAGADALGGEVATITSVPLNGQLAGFERTAPISARRVGIRLDEALDSRAPGGTECRIVIELGRQSPLALFGLRRP